MPKALAIIEISRKQDYIFGAKQLRENAARSQEINHITSEAYFENVFPEYSENNLVYTGGGHAVLQFDSMEKAKTFVRKISEKTLRTYPVLELFAKCLEYNPNLTPKENHHNLIALLEQKKSQRITCLRQTTLGLEKFQGVFPIKADQNQKSSSYNKNIISHPSGWCYPNNFEVLSGNDNFISVIHIDGNSMGKRVSKVFDCSSSDWDLCRESIQTFSKSVQKDFEWAFIQTVNEIINQTNLGTIIPSSETELPIRPVIIAGDDICFVTKGNIGLECARVFLEFLSQRKNAFDGKPYAACAGIAIVHSKYPFHRAYELSEELCSNAKKFSANTSAESTVSAIDWHIEYGQLKDSLHDIRTDYVTDDNCHLELRPLKITDTEERTNTEGDHSEYDYCTYSEFLRMINKLIHSRSDLSKSKIKQLRTALKQGELETDYFLSSNSIRDLLYNVIPDTQRYAKQLLLDGQQASKPSFIQIGDDRHCLFFDSIESMDHFIAFKEAEK